MHKNWYYADGVEEIGPVTVDDIKRLIAEQKITATTLVWHEGMDNWRKAEESELAELLSQPADSTYKYCSICGKSFPADELIEINGRLSCAVCKPQAIRQCQSGFQLSGVRFAGFWIRALATILDGVVMLILQLGIGFILNLLILNSFELEVIKAVINMLISASYVICMTKLKGATLGQMAVKIRIINADGSHDISWGKAIARYFACYVSAMVLYIGYLMVAWDREKRALHDVICNTRVIYDREQ